MRGAHGFGGGWRMDDGRDEDQFISVDYVVGGGVSCRFNPIDNHVRADYDYDWV